MAKKASSIDQIQKKLLAHIEEMEALFPMPMSIAVIGRDENGLGCEFVIGRDTPVELMGILERTVQRLADAEKEAPKKKKAAPKAKKKSKK